MPFTFDPEVDYAPAPSPPTSAAHMGPSWNAVWRIAISNPDKVAALAEAKGMIKEKLRWERAVAAEKRERMRVGVSAWKLARELDEWKTQPPLQGPQQLKRSIPNNATQIFQVVLKRSCEPATNDEYAHATALSLSETVALFPTHAPYLFTHPQLLMSTRLILMGDEIAKKLDTVGIEVGDDWHERTRDEFLWTYCGDWEKRPIDCVERTYLATRDEVRWYVENDVDKGGNAIMAASVDGSDGEASNGQDGENEQAENDEDLELED